MKDIVEKDSEPHPMDASDGSDIEEEDVKVCDICGDAGREDKLAVCCRCSDGAEHTYCMREVLDEVPEDDWLCEECKFDEDLKSKRKDNNVRVDGNEKSSSGQASSVHTNLLVKSEAISSDDEGNRVNKDPSHKKVLGKRHTEDAEVSSVAKKQALEPATRSPKELSPSRKLAPPRDSSFKNLGREKVKSAYQSSSSILSNNDTPVDNSSASGHRSQTPLGTFLKSKSFNSLNAKHKVKLDEDFPLKQKTVEDTTSLDVNYAATKSIGKSASFKSTNSGRFGATEPKVKMLSPSFSHVHDVKGLKHVKERNAFERKNSFRSGCSVANSVVADSNLSTDRTDKELDSFDGTSMPSTTKIDSETKIAQSDRKSTASIKSSDAVSYNPLKAAIEAARLVKPGLIRKHKVPDQNGDVAKSSTNAQFNSQVQLSNSSRMNVSLAEKGHQGNVVLQNSASGHSKQATANNVKQFTGLSVEVPTSEAEDAGPTIPFQYLPMETAIPEHEYIWQGIFQVQRNGKAPEIYDGVQAHLSTSASSKVIDTINRFSRKMLLNEVPRLTAWPIQFQECGVREDNIALFFFAKDLGSYEKSYLVLLENLMRKDLALKVDHDGVDLLIFPSNHLPKSSQRWNMSFFLWGVFRAKKVNCQQWSSDLKRQSYVSQCTPAAAMSLPGTTVRVLPGHGNIALASMMPVSRPSNSLSSSEKVNEDCGSESSSQDYKGDCKQMVLQRRLDADSSSVMQCSSSKLEQETRQIVDKEDLSNPSSNSCQVKVGTDSEDGSTDERAREREVAKRNTDIEELKGQTLNARKLDVAETVQPAASSASLDQAISGTCSDMIAEETHNPKPRGGLTNPDDNSSYPMASGSPVRENGRNESLCETAASGCSGNAEKHFFPIDPHSVKDIDLVEESTSWKVHPSAKDQVHEITPNLELALGDEIKPSAHDIPPFVVGKKDEKSFQVHHLDNPPAREEDISSSLSLSLSCPRPDEDETNSSDIQNEQLVSNQQQANTKSFPFRDK